MNSLIFYYSIFTPYSCINNICLTWIWSICCGKGISYYVKIITIKLHISKWIQVSFVSNNLNPKSCSIGPSIANNSNIRVILTWQFTWLIYSAIMIFILVDFNRYIDSFIVFVNSYTFWYFHDIWVFWLDEILCEVVLSAKFGKIVAAYSITMIVRSKNTDNISVLAFKLSSSLTINIDISLQQEFRFLINHFPIFDKSCRSSYIIGKSEYSDLIRVFMKSH